MIALILILACVGLLVWAVTRFVPMDAAFQRLIVIVAIVACILYCLAAFGVLGELPVVRVR